MTDSRWINALDALLEDMDAAHALYRPTPFWKAALERLVDELRTAGPQGFRSLPGPLAFFVPTYGFPGYSASPSRFEPVRDAVRELRLPDARCDALTERLLSGESHAESD